ncbi:MAG: dihydrolipoamide acetyltransferase family protein [Paludibacter sp.]|jgi:pyruvate dehydrogenase E2 component (dihydrolipoamide acetyltransferase)|nr:dihydrolipoamide acetyltransferase family protein [Paludibacter sp.]
MATVIILPKQGQSVESCIITEIKKKKGDTVAKGDILFSYETDKASFEEESPVDGVVLECFYNDGDEVPVLLDMMVIGQPGEKATLTSQTDSPPTPHRGDLEVQQSDKKEVQMPNNVVLTPLKGAGGLSPRAKNLAAAEAIDASQLAGSGPNGRVIEKDVKAALESRPKLTPLAKKIAAEEGAQPQGAGSGLAGMAKSTDLAATVNTIYGVDYEDKKLSNMRKIIAKSMHASLQNSAQLTHHLGADARNIQNLRKKAKAAFEAGTLSANLTINDFVCFAVVKALKKFPNANSHFLGDSMRLFNKVHLGLAVDTERGLMVPAVRNADDLSITGLSNQLKEVANACKKGAIAPELLAAEAATFTVSNLGAYGVEMFTPVINLPQSAILGVNTIVPRPKDLGDGVYGFVPYIGLSLTYDHRALDGGEATRFLKQIAIEIETLELEILAP